MLGLIRFEMFLLLRAPSVWVVLLACFALGIAVPLDEMGVGMQSLDLVAPYRSQYFMVLSSLICPIALLIAIPLSFNRDASCHFQQLSFCFPWPRRFWSKWVAVLALLLISLLAVPLGLALGFLVKVEGALPWFVWLFSSVLPAWFWVGAVNAVVMMAIMVWACHRWKSPFTPYLSGIAILLLFWIGQALTGMPMLGVTPMVDASRWQWAMVLDPFGLSSFFHETAYLTVAAKNSQAFPTSASLLLNRMIWLMIAGLCLWRTLVWVRKPIETRSEAGRPKKPDLPERILEGNLLPAYEPRLGGGHVAVFLHEWRSVYRSWPFVGCMAIWCSLCILGLLMVFGTFSEGVSPRLPATSLILSYSGEPFFFFGSLMAVVYCASILWRERQAGIEGLIHSVPVANASFFFAKYGAFTLVFAAMVMVMIAVGVGYQFIAGYEAIDYRHWLQAFYYFGLPVLVQGTVIFVIQARAHARQYHRMTAMATSAAVVIALKLIPGKLPWSHPLLQAFSFPNLLRRHSEMRGYAQWGQLFDHMALLWGAAIIPLMMLAWKGWPRPGPLPKSWHWGLALSLLVSFSMVGWTAVLYQRQVPFAGNRETQARADYEKRFGHLVGRAVPQVMHAYNEVDLFPEEKRLEVSAVCQVKNTSAEDIVTLLITGRQPMNKVTFNIPFQIQRIDPVLNVSLVTFEKPWSRDESLTFSYQTTLTSTRFVMNLALGRKSSYFLQTQFEPVLGYYEGLELRDPEVRDAHGLPEKSLKREDRHTMYGRFVQNKRTFETRFSTSASQTPLTSGETRESMVRAGRRTTRFVAETPVYPVVGYFSGDYETHSFEAQGIPVTVYIHPGHTQNLDQVKRSIGEAMAYCNRYFGPYPYTSLSVVEIPGTFPTGGRASAGVIALNEWGLFMLDPDPGRSVHTVVRRTVHEVVHQWFGEKLVPKIANGERVLNESITKYVEAMIVEDLLGPDMLRTMNLANRHRYFSGRSRDAEESPLVAANESYLCYGKGALVFQELAELWGEERLNRLLKSFVEDHRQGMTATMPDLVARLLAEAGEADRHQVENGFLKRVTYEFRLEAVDVERLADGTWLVLRIDAQCQDGDETGAIKVTSSEVPLRVGLADTDPRKGLMALNQLETIRIRDGRGRVRIKVDRIPKYIMLDPFARRLHADSSDHVYALKNLPRTP